MGDQMSRCETCYAPCNFDHRYCRKHGGPLLTHWQDAFSPRMKQHIAFCRNYAEHFNHGAPGHLDYTLIADLVGLIEARNPTPARLVVQWDLQGGCYRDVQTGVRVDIESGVILGETTEVSP